MATNTGRRFFLKAAASTLAASTLAGRISYSGEFLDLEVVEAGDDEPLPAFYATSVVCISPATAAVFGGTWEVIVNGERFAYESLGGESAADVAEQLRAALAACELPIEVTS